MRQALERFYQGAVAMASGRVAEGLALLLTRVALAHVFWASGRTKVAEGSFVTLSDSARYLFETEYSSVPLPPWLAAHLALYAETVLPILLVLGLATRLSALGLMGMTLVIQIFVYPQSWWNPHALWLSMAALLVVRGGGLFSLDAVIAKRRRA